MHAKFSESRVFFIKNSLAKTSFATSAENVSQSNMKCSLRN